MGFVGEIFWFEGLSGEGVGVSLSVRLEIGRKWLRFWVCVLLECRGVFGK